MAKTDRLFAWRCVYRVGDEFYKLPFKFQNTPVADADVIDYLEANGELKFYAGDIDDLNLIIIDHHDRVCEIIELEPLNFWPNLSEEDLDTIFDLIMSSLRECEEGGEKKSNGKD